MKRSPSSTSGFAIVIGFLLLLEGIWGLFSNTVFGFLTTNTTHAVIHIILGLVGIWLGMKQNAKAYCLFLGLLLLLVGILRFVPAADDLIIKLLNVNKAVAYVNIVVGIIALVVSQSGKRKNNF